MSARQAFRQAALDHALTLPECIKADGLIHRFATSKRSCDRAGWYQLTDGEEAHGAFGCWRSGVSVGWSARNRSEQLSAGELQKIQAKMEMQRREELRILAIRHAEKALDMRQTWARATDTDSTPSHAYLTKKMLPGLGLRRLREVLLAPLFDENGVIQGGQTIGADGAKRFFAGARKKGLFCPIGWLPGEPLTELLIAEGWASGCAAHLMFGLPAIASMDAGNLLPAARSIRQRYPNTKLIFACDWDGPGGGIGFAAASAAAFAVGNSRVIKPVCPDDAHCDFADVWLQTRGAA